MCQPCCSWQERRPYNRFAKEQYPFAAKQLADVSKFLAKP